VSTTQTNASESPPVGSPGRYPIMVMFALHQIRTRQSQANPRVLLRFGALYDGYKPNAYAFELMHLLRQG
jgi:hypothetical protein